MTLAWFGALAAVGVAVIVFGLATRRPPLVLLGSSLLVSLAGAWVFGPYGFGFGWLALAGGWFGRKRKT